MKKILQFSPILLLAVLAGCGGAPEWPPAPAAIHLGEDICSACKMIISEEHYGAQLHEPGKPVKLFDDYGCFLKERSVEGTTRVIYVRSNENGEWLREDQTFFVVSRQIPSPMDYGIAAFSNRESAAEFNGNLQNSEIYSSLELAQSVEKILRREPQKKE